MVGKKRRRRWITDGSFGKLDLASSIMVDPNEFDTRVLLLSSGVTSRAIPVTGPEVLFDRQMILTSDSTSASDIQVSCRSHGSKTIFLSTLG